MYLQTERKEVCGAGLQADLYNRGMPEYGNRIRKRREELGLSQPQLAKKIGGISYQAIQAIEKGGQTKHLNAIARALGVRADWLETGEGPMDPAEGRPEGISETPSPGPALPRFDLMPRNVPVYGSAACATGEEGEFEFNVGVAVDFVKRPPRLEGVREAYALYLTGTSMLPWRKEGALVYVHPGQPPQIEGHVVVQLKPTREGDAPHAMVKQLIKVTAKDILLHQYNPPRDRSFARNKLVAVHRVLEWEELLGV